MRHFDLFFIAGYLAYRHTCFRRPPPQHDALPIVSRTMLFFIVLVAVIILVIAGLYALRNQGLHHPERNAMPAAIAEIGEE